MDLAACPAYRPNAANGKACDGICSPPEAIRRRFVTVGYTAHGGTVTGHFDALPRQSLTYELAQLLASFYV